MIAFPLRTRLSVLSSRTGLVTFKAKSNQKPFSIPLVPFAEPATHKKAVSALFLLEVLHSAYCATPNTIPLRYEAWQCFMTISALFFYFSGTGD